VNPPLGNSDGGLLLDSAYRSTAFLQSWLSYQVMLGVFCEPHGNHRTTQYGGSDPVKVSESLPQDGAIVHSRGHDDLGVELDSVLSEPAKLGDDVRSGRISEEVAPNSGVGGVHRNVQWREPIFDDPLLVVWLQVGKSCEIPVAKGKSIIIVPDIKHITKAVR
jgi:hypothetical protein